MRQTSIEAFNTIKSNGLLSKRRMEVYEFIFENGPCTCRQVVKAISKVKGESVSITYSSYSSRFSELKESGVIVEAGHVEDDETGNTVILWEVTGRLPAVKTKKEKILKMIDVTNRKLARLHEELAKAEA